MRYRILHNVDMHWGNLSPRNDRFVEGYQGNIIDSARHSEDLLEEIFMKHNRDDRPDGKTRPSLSTGDVVLLGFEARPWAVDSIGFKAVTTPVHVYESYEELDEQSQIDHNLGIRHNGRCCA